jgi:hypothetical protein
MKHLATLAWLAALALALVHTPGWWKLAVVPGLIAAGFIAGAAADIVRHQRHRRRLRRALGGRIRP